MDETFNPQNQGAQQPQPDQQAGGYAEPTMLFRPKRKKGALTAIIILIILALAGGGTVLAMRVWDPVWNPFRPNPEEVISAAINNLLSPTIKSSHNAMIISADVKSVYSGKFVLSAISDSDITDSNNLKAQQEFDVSLTGDFFGAGNPSNFSIKIGSKVIGSDLYASLIDVDPAIAALASAQGTDINSLKGIWIKISQGDIQQLQQLQQNNSISVTPANFNVADHQKQMQEVVKNIINSKIYTVKQQLDDQDVAGQKVYHYLIAMDNTKLAAGLTNSVQQAMQSANSSLSAESQNNFTLLTMVLAAAKTEITDVFNKIGEIDIDLFIGKNDSQLYGFEAEKNLDLGKISDNQITGTADLIFKLGRSNLNQPANIQTPANAQNLEDMSIFKEAMLKAKDAQIESYAASLPVLAEISYEKNNTYLDFSCQNANIQPTCDKIKAITGEDVIIHQSKKYYCVYTKILKTLKNKIQYWCGDASGFRSVSTTNPGLSGYCSIKTFKCP